MSPDSKVIFIFVALTVAAGVILYLPFFLWFAWKRRQHRTEIRTEIRLTKTGWIFSVLLVALMFGLLATAKLAPESFVGSIFDAVGEWTVIGALFVVEVVVDLVLRSLGFPTSYRKVVLPRPSSV